MINKAFVALIFSFLTANQVLAYDEVEGRCFSLNKLKKEHEELVNFGSKDGLYSIFFKFEAIAGIAANNSLINRDQQIKSVLTKEDYKTYLGLKNDQFRIEENNEYKEGAAKDEATRKTFYKLNTLAQRMFIEINERFPECMILNGGKQSKPTSTQPAAKPASGTSVK